MLRPAALLGLALFVAGCVSTHEIVVGETPVTINQSELTHNRQGERVVDVVAIQRFPMFTDYSPEIEENLLAAGEQEAKRYCPRVELATSFRPRMTARTAQLRFRCL